MLKSKIIGFIDTLNSAQTEEEIWKVTENFFQNRGFERVVYMDLQPGRHVMHTNLPDWWMSYYLAEGYAEHDAIFDYCGSSCQPQVIGREFLNEKFRNFTPIQRKIIEEAGDAGTVAGFISTVRPMGDDGIACWAAAGDMTKEDLRRIWQESGEILNLVTHLSYNAMQARIGFSATPELSAIERKVMQQLASGFSPKEIALRISFKPEEVNYHLAMAQQKMANQSKNGELAKVFAKRVIGF
ncbi:autoinducer binding domain-containing protein [Cohaesibacter gelatinilyticus]|uniref:DNA-binding transcriptional regulator, CsgD family n=1 Tax=Cohaesibacter gelatinilyticus TaxID=372072 RepID=A0A285NGK1_9HYPH|nr:autoinducer binding domain-containing protein [Cohaesibacter gelatinilyticus]SNZ07016.1 DNA-binding transcriptional regulator, CsgD family [Cohaesibacter gelatinilyticus]